jgi:hypothetical protein
VSDADGAREGTRLRLGGGELELLREWWTLGGWWRAGVVGWLDAMAAYRAIALAPYWVMGARLAGFDGDELVLLDDAGGEFGRLVRADP